jgi:replicative DNA helicase
MQQLDKYNFSDDFQDLLLACMLRHQHEFAVQGEIIAPKFFNGAAAFDACYEIKDYAKTYGKFPTFTMLGNLVYQRYATRNPDRAKECVEYIKKLAQIKTDNVVGVRDLVVKFSRERAVQSALRVAMDASYKGEEVKGGLIKLFEDALATGSNMEDIGIWLHNDQDLVREKLESVDFGVRTGFEKLDNVWKRGWGKGWLIVPLAPPKRYKSTFCLNLALNMANSTNQASVFYYACEIDQELAMMRALLNITGETEEVMFDKRKEQFWIKAKQLADSEVVGDIMFKSFPAKTATIAQIQAHATNVIKQTGIQPRAIVIDYAETIRPSEDKGVSDWRQQAEIYTSARAMGHKLGCCIIMPDRCNADAVERKVPSMKSFQGSFEKAGIVDAAIGLCATEAEHQQGICRYFIFINRHGPQYLHFRGKVDPAKYKMTIDEEIEYDPEAEEENGTKYKSKKKTFKRSPSKKELEDGVDALNEDG